MSDTRAGVVVIGGGPAGIAAAASAAEAGADTLLVDDGARTGGQIWRHGPHAAMSRTAHAWHERLKRSGARTLAGTTVVDVTANAGGTRTLLGECGGQPLHIHAMTAVILAVGARERFLPFPGWTLPGVVGVGGAQALLKNGLLVADRHVVIAGSGPLLFPVAAAMARAGARVEIVAEQASARAVNAFARSLWRTPGRLVDAGRYRLAFHGAEYRKGMWVTHAHGAEQVTEAVLTDGGSRRVVQCDLLCVGYGLVPALELPRLFGCALTPDGVSVDAAQRTSVSGVFCAGEPTGIAGMDAAVVQGRIAGFAAAGRDREAETLRDERDRHAAFARRLDKAFALRNELRHIAQADTIVCRCEDIRSERLGVCGSAREAKLYTRAGMGPCQGRVCGPALEFLYGWTPDTIRPPVAPARIGTLADEVA